MSNPATPEFPNGFEDWHETHFEVVKAITAISESLEPHGAVEKRQDEQGFGGLYLLAAELTNEFDNQYKGTVWGEELEYFETIEKFLDEKLK